MNERSHRYSVERKNRNSSSCNDGERSKTPEKEETPTPPPPTPNVETPPVAEEQSGTGDDKSESKEAMEKMAMEAKSAAEERIQARTDLRNVNLKSVQARPDESFFKQVHDTK